LIPFVKVQSIGNDFVLIEHPGEIDLGSLAVRMCVRHTSIGSDGLLVLRPVDRHRFEMRMFNPDGSEDFCGNGLRCAAVYAAEQGWVDAEREFTIEHYGRNVRCMVEGNRASTVLGKATFRAAEVPWGTEAQANDEWFDREIEATGWAGPVSLISTGSTHTVIFVTELPDDDTVAKVGAALEHHPIFPIRTSVIWVKRIVSDHLQIRIWERGVGETLGCGTGSSAAAVVEARRDGRAGPRTIRVDNPGGTVRVSFDAWDGEIGITGEAFRVYSGEFRG
jgi:diaminopimelate epimerase